MTAEHPSTRDSRHSRSPSGLFLPADVRTKNRLMAEAALTQMDRDLDDLYEWLEATECGNAICEEPVR